MSYAELSKALQSLVLEKRELTLTELSCLQSSLKNRLLVASLSLYPLPKSLQKIITRSIERLRALNPERALDTNVHSAIYGGAREITGHFLKTNFPPTGSVNILERLERFLEKVLINSVFQKELLVAEEERYNTRLKKYMAQELSVLESKQLLQGIKCDFVDYLSHLTELKNNGSPYCWSILESIFIRMDHISPESNQEAELLLLRALDDGRTGYHDKEYKFFLGRNYTCQKGLEERILDQYYTVVPYDGLPQDADHKVVAELTTPFILHDAQMQQEGVRLTFSPALYALYIECAGYTLKQQEHHIYKLCIEDDALLSLKEQYKSEFAGALKQKAAMDFNAVCSLLKKKLLTVESNAYKKILDFLKTKNAVTETVAPYVDLQPPALLKSDELIITEMLQRGPFIDRAHLEMILALHDPNGSLNTLYQAATQGTEVATTDILPSRQMMELIYTDYLEKQEQSLFYDFYINNHFLSERLQDANLQVIPASQSALCYFLEYYEEQTSLIQKENLAVLCAKAGYFKAMSLLCRTINPDHRDQEEQETLLEICIKNGQIATVRALLENGANPNISGSQQAYPIHHAAELGELSFIQALIHWGVDINIQDQSLRSALHIASQRGDLHIVNALIGFNAHLDLKDRLGNTALHKAAELGYQDIVESLIAAGAIIDSINERNATPLYLAASGGHTRCVSLLIKASVKEIDHTDTAGCTALHKAVERGHRSVAEILLSAGASPNIQDASGTTVLHKAMLCGDLVIANTLRESGAGSFSDKPLGFKKVIRHSATPLMKALFSADVPSNIKYHTELARHSDTRYRTHKSVKKTDVNYGQPDVGEDRIVMMPLHEAAARGHLATVETLLNAGANSDLQNSFGKTPLHLAASHGELLVIQAFLASELELELADAQGQTALHFAAEGGHSEIVKVLASAGLNPDLQNKEGFSALHFAVRRGKEDCVLELLAAGANPDLMHHGKYESKAAIHIAVLSKNLSILRMLLEAGANPDLQDSQGATALHLAVALKDEKCVELLIAAGASSFLRDNHGRTALQLAHSHTIDILSPSPSCQEHQLFKVTKSQLRQAVKSGSLEKTQELLSAAMNINFLESGESLLDVAIMQKNREMIQLLIACDKLSPAFIIKNIKQCVESKALHDLLSLLLLPDIIKVMKQYKLQKAAVAWAAQHDCPEAVAAFINAGSSCFEKDRYGQTAWDYASQLNNQEVLDILAQSEHRSALINAAPCLFPQRTLTQSQSLGLRR